MIPQPSDLDLEALIDVLTLQHPSLKERNRQEMEKELIDQFNSFATLFMADPRNKEKRFTKIWARFFLSAVESYSSGNQIR